MRVGIVQESIVLPGVAVTYLTRDLPTVNRAGARTAAQNGQDMLSIRDFNLAPRRGGCVASKHFVVFGLAAGIGQDKYSQSATVQANVQSNGFSYTSSPIAFSQDVTRTNMFADLSINFPILKLIAEVGQVSGGAVSTYNQFSKDANASRLYGSVGLRLAW